MLLIHDASPEYDSLPYYNKVMNEIMIEWCSRICRALLPVNTTLWTISC
jgi:hypothetical protein